MEDRENADVESILQRRATVDSRWRATSCSERVCIVETLAHGSERWISVAQRTIVSIVRGQQGKLIHIEHDRQAAEIGGRAAARRTGGDASTLRSESHIPRRSIRSCTVGCGLCSGRDSTAINPCRRSQALVAAGYAVIGAMARTANARRVAA